MGSAGSEPGSAEGGTGLAQEPPEVLTGALECVGVYDGACKLLEPLEEEVLEELLDEP